MVTPHSLAVVSGLAGSVARRDGAIGRVSLALILLVMRVGQSVVPSVACAIVDEVVAIASLQFCADDDAREFVNRGHAFLWPDTLL